MHQTARHHMRNNVNLTECGNARKHTKSAFIKAEKVFTEFSLGIFGQA